VSFLPPGTQQNKVDSLLAGRMTFINQVQVIRWMPEWDQAELPKLWQYNLHYFEWLWAFSGDGYALAKEVVLDWIDRYPLVKGRVGWDPYPSALRLMNWCAFFFGEHRSLLRFDEEFTEKIWESVWLQSEWLLRHQEHHLLGNHLLKDAAALAMVGVCFNGPDAERWLGVGLDLLRGQVREQVLDDGLHFELSPMYHSRIVYLLLTLFNTGHQGIQAEVGPVLEPMLNALAKVLHPDGQIALLNDSALGVYNSPRELFDYGARLGALKQTIDNQGTGPWALSDAGYYGFRGEDGSYIICDAGPLGPDYIPGHAHADILSFELSLKGHRVIVDSGVYDYEWSEARRFCRSTLAHNTVQIEGSDQAEMWGAFRVARRSYPRDVDWKPSAGGFTLSAWHDGYRRLSGRPIHRRSFDYQGSGHLYITDRVTAACDVACRSHLHLHPDCRCDQQGDDAVLVHYPAGRFLVKFSGSGRLECQDGHYHPDFYITQRNTVLAYSWTALSGSEETRFSIEPQP
jgi:uncharacterized heparinase superfamily protein